MKSRNLSLAALLAFLFVPVAYLNLLMHFVRTGDPFMLKRLVISPNFWLTLLGCIAVGVGLRRGSAIAWLGGLLGAAWLLYPRVIASLQLFNFIPLGITILVLGAFIVLLLTSPPRKVF